MCWRDRLSVVANVAQIMGTLVAVAALLVALAGLVLAVMMYFATRSPGTVTVAPPPPVPIIVVDNNP